MKKLGLAILSAAVVAMAFTACSGPTPTPAPTEPSSATSATPDPTPTADAAPEAASLIVSVEGISILAADGEVIATFGYFDADAAPAIAALTETFGEAPTESRSDSSYHPEFNSVNSHWGGFELRAMESEMRFPETPAFKVLSTVDKYNEITIQTSDGVHVGMSIADAKPLSYREWVGTGTGTAKAVLLFEQKPVEIPYGSDYEPAAISVVVSGTESGGVIEEIMAPGANFGV